MDEDPVLVERGSFDGSDATAPISPVANGGGGGAASNDAVDEEDPVLEGEEGQEDQENGEGEEVELEQEVEDKPTTTTSTIKEKEESPISPMPGSKSPARSFGSPATEKFVTGVSGLMKAVQLNSIATMPLAMAPDEAIETMPRILVKKIPDCTIQKWYKTCWSDGAGGSDDGGTGSSSSFYKSWLVSQGCTGVTIGPWEHAFSAYDKFTSEWDGEVYSQRREVTYKTAKSSPVISVKQTQYCEMFDNDRCILAMYIELAGAPFSDSYTQHVRWVATRRGDGDLSIRVGFVMIFTREIMAASKVRTSTQKEATDEQTKLFRLMIKTLSPPVEGTGLGSPLRSGSTGGSRRDSWKLVRDFVVNKGDSISKKIMQDIDNIKLDEIDPMEAVGTVVTPLVKPLLKMKEDHDNAVAHDKLMDRNIEQNVEEHAEETGPGPDEQLSKMKILMTKQFPKVTVMEWFKTCWSGGKKVRGSKPPLYQVWLSGDGCSNVSVGPWQYSKNAVADGISAECDEEDESKQSEMFLNEYDNQFYSFKRDVTFQYERTPGMKTSTVQVKQTHYCKILGKERCVVALHSEEVGVPFSDAYSWHIRWVATKREAEEQEPPKEEEAKDGANDEGAIVVVDEKSKGGGGGDDDNDVGLSVVIGFDVVFKRDIAAAGKIRSKLQTIATRKQTGLFIRHKTELATQRAERELAKKQRETGIYKLVDDINVQKDMLVKKSQPIQDMLVKKSQPMLYMFFPFLQPTELPALGPSQEVGSSTTSTATRSVRDMDDEAGIKYAVREIRSKLRIVETLPMLKVGDERVELVREIRTELVDVDQALDRIIERYGPTTSTATTPDTPAAETESTTEGVSDIGKEFLLAASFAA